MNLPQARVGSIVKIEIPNGRKLVNGRTVPEFTEIKAKVHIVMPTHLVCRKLGSSGAYPYCAETYKLVKY